MPQISFNSSLLINTLQSLDLPRIARSCAFTKRLPRKITPLGLASSACLLSALNHYSLSSWASLCCFLRNMPVSKQALAKRCTPEAVAFLGQVLQRLLAKSWNAKALPGNTFSSFSRVLIQDSTVVALPSKLLKEFPGPRNSTGKHFASMKIQSIYDLKAEKFLKFELTPFTVNDQKASKLIFEVATQSDLIIRDLGYSVLADFQQMTGQKMFYLSRLRSAVHILDAKTSRPIELLKHLRKFGGCDIEVHIGSTNKVPVRLVACRLAPDVAAARRRKARANRDRRLRHSDEYMELLGWAIFITNVSSDIWTPKQICEVYGIRWRIETWFKAWKTHFNFCQVTAGSAEQMRLLFYGRLIWISIFQVVVRQCRFLEEEISLLKLARWTKDFLFASIFASMNPKRQNPSLKFLTYYCKYEKRRKRIHFLQKLKHLS